MHVAAFARALGPQPTGRGVAARELIEALVRRKDIHGLDVFAGEALQLPGCRLRRARGSTLLSDAWRVFRGVAREVRRIRPDVFWSATHFLPAGLPPTVPTVVTLLDLVWRDHPETMSRPTRMAAVWLERSLRHAHRIVCISEFVRQRLLDRWPDLAAVSSVMHLAPSTHLLAARPALDVRERLGLAGPFLLTVGTIEPRKNLAVLLAAMEALPDLQLLHCGPMGWNTRDLVRRASTLPNVRFLGYVEDTVLGALYRHAVAAVFPSLYEGIHLPTLDAASLGCPLIVSDIPVHREILADTARYFPTHDARALSGQVRTLLESASERERRAQMARERATRFSWDGAAAQLVAVFRAAVETRSA